MNARILIGIFLLSLFSCIKKVDLDIKKPAREYVVIFGILANTAATNTVNVSVTEGFDGSKPSRDVNAVIKMETVFGSGFFNNKGNGVFTTSTPIAANSPYRFTCVYNNKSYVYETVTANKLGIDSLYLASQANGKYRATARLKSPDQYGFALMQMYIGRVQPSSTDTVWQTYNERFPDAKRKIRFLSPFIMQFKGTEPLTIEILEDVQPASGELMKLEVYSIDVWTTQYLLQLDAPDNYIYDPLSLAPPLNYFAFTNQGLGVIAPALVTQKITGM